MYDYYCIRVRDGGRDDLRIIFEYLLHGFRIVENRILSCNYVIY